MTKDEILVKLKEIVRQNGSQSTAALSLGVSPSYLGEVLRGTREPGEKILEALGLVRETVYKETENER